MIWLWRSIWTFVFCWILLWDPLRMIVCWPGSLILLWWYYDYNKPRPEERTRHPGLYTQMIMDIQNRHRSKVPDIPDSSKQSTLHYLQAENKRLQDELKQKRGPGTVYARMQVVYDYVEKACPEYNKLSSATTAERTLIESHKRLREENAALQERLENKDCSQCGSKLDIYGVCLSADVHGNCTKHREAIDWVNTPHQCSPGTCGHQPATLHIDCADPWHRLPSQEISFSCPTCRAA